MQIRAFDCSLHSSYKNEQILNTNIIENTTQFNNQFLEAELKKNFICCKTLKQQQNFKQEYIVQNDQNLYNYKINNPQFNSKILCLEINLVPDLCLTNRWYISNLNNGSICHNDCYSLSKTIFGGFNSFKQNTIISKTVILPPHYKLILAGKFYGFDTYSSYYLYIFADNIDLTLKTYDFKGNFCNTSYYSFPQTLSQVFYHTSNSLTLFIYTKYSYSWGISSLVLSVHECKGCNNCDNNGICNGFLRYSELQLNPLKAAIEGWNYNGDQLATQYNIIGNEFDGLQGLFLKNSQAVKQFLIFVNGFYRVSVKVLLRNIIHFTVEIFINQKLVSSSSNYGVINFACCQEIYTVQEFKSPILSIKGNIEIKINIIWYYQCQSACDSYTNVCIRDFELLYQQQFQNECEDNNLVPFDGCFQNFYSCAEGCKDCLKGICLRCNNGWMMKKAIKKCYPICGDKIVTYFEECDDGNQISNDGCHQCKYSCILNCEVCIQGLCSKCIEPYQLIANKCIIVSDQHYINQQGQRIEGYYNQIYNEIEIGYQQNLALSQKDYQFKRYQQSKCQIQDYSIFGYFYNQCMIKFIPYCVQMNFQTCSNCETGYDFDFPKKQCHPKCGDAIKQSYEECDDNNGNRQFHGCYNCQNSCQMECLVCNYQKCLQCKKGWVLDNGLCIFRCGDGFVAEGSYEQCDDAMANLDVGCIDCKLICSSNCINCQSSDFCITCEKYYELIDNRYCKPICGDKYAIEGLEDCDDGNNIEYDGCHNCIYSCKKGCENCQQGQCINMCANEGYYYNEQIQKCESKCGDGIIAKFDEQCEDGNDIEFDGCYQCLYSCDESICEKCDNGQCKLCGVGYQLKNGICFDQCGNGNKSNIEECDDGNIVNKDGCSSSCEIESNQYYCDVTISPTKCKERPFIQLTFLNQRRFLVCQNEFFQSSSYYFKQYKIC